ncbi:SHOCT domain-containing protein [Halorhabdus salina]|uniref:SHOCT domain-containing protein n=1 Tax=Halorhabdus salina TaxID=2750670 RepID=UPI0015EF7EE2|nr:SHOCT domain-containing protein [Halorhabdus salina]
MLRDDVSDASRLRARSRAQSESERLGRHAGTATVRFALSALALVAATGVASAQHAGGGMGGGGFSGFGGPGFGLVFWLLLGLGIVLLVAYARDGDRSKPDAHSTDRALETLRERYARGDISSEEFEARRMELERSR